MNLFEFIMYSILSTVYSLFGAGMHGLNGLNPKTAIQLWKTYVTPRMLYGLDITINSPREIEKIEDYQRKTLKQLQHLPPNTSNPAVYLLAGTLPIQAEVDKRILTTFVRFISNKTSTEFHIIRRQAVMKDLESSSWTKSIKELLFKYNLPSIYDILELTPEKKAWKQDVKKAIIAKTIKLLIADMENQSSVKYINVNACSVTKPHHIWTTPGSNVRKIARANIKAKLLTGTYTLEGKNSNSKTTILAAYVPYATSKLKIENILS